MTVLAEYLAFIRYRWSRRGRWAARCARERGMV